MSDNWQADEQNQAPLLPHEMLTPGKLGAETPTGLPPLTKKVVMQLTYIAATKRYRIRTITNTSYYQPDQWLSIEGLAIIASRYPNWEFAVDTPDYLGALLGIAQRVVPGAAAFL